MTKCKQKEKSEFEKNMAKAERRLNELNKLDVSSCKFDLFRKQLNAYDLSERLCLKYPEFKVAKPDSKTVYAGYKNGEWCTSDNKTGFDNNQFVKHQSNELFLERYTGFQNALNRFANKLAHANYVQALADLFETNAFEAKKRADAVLNVMVAYMEDYTAGIFFGGELASKNGELPVNYTERYRAVEKMYQAFYGKNECQEDEF